MLVQVVQYEVQVLIVFCATCSIYNMWRQEITHIVDVVYIYCGLRVSHGSKHVVFIIYMFSREGPPMASLCN